jgi:hypothetical protein
MKTIFLLPLILSLYFFNNRAFSQDLIEETSHKIGYRIGELDNNDVYSLGNYIIPNYFDEPYALVTFEGKSLRRLYTYNGKEEDYHKWFIHHNQLYSVSSSKVDDEDYKLRLKQYDINFHVVDSTILFQDSMKQYNNSTISFKQDDNSFSIIGLSGMVDSLGFVAIINLETKESLFKSFSIPSFDRYTCTDFTWNKRQELIAVFEGSENMNPRYRESKASKKWKTYLMNLSAPEVLFVPVSAEIDSMVIRSFKLLKLNERETILGGLAFAIVGEKKQQKSYFYGYYKSILGFTNTEFRDKKFLNAKTIFDSTLWIKYQFDDFEDLSSQKLNNLFLKEIRLLNNENLLFISEVNTILTGGGSISTTVSATNMSQMSSPNSAPSYTTRTVGSTTHGISYLSDEDIIISKIIEDSVVWNTKPRHLFQRPLSITHADSYHLTNPCYLLIQFDDEQLSIYYDDDKKIFTKEGKLKDSFTLFDSPHSVLVEFKINLTTGKSETKPALSDFKSRKNEEISVYGSYFDGTNIKLLINCISGFSSKSKYKTTQIMK